jgi:hypothetical protein
VPGGFAFAVETALFLFRAGATEADAIGRRLGFALEPLATFLFVSCYFPESGEI